MSPKPATLAKARKAAGLGAQGAGGRPPRYAYDPTTLHGQRDAARGKAGAALDEVVEFWLTVMRDTGAEYGDRIRAAENLADRAGLARKTETELTGELPQKLWSLGTYRDKDGAHHELPRDPSGDPPTA